MKKRIIAFLLCFAMVLPILPVNAVTVDDVCTCNTETETHAETCALYEAPAPTCSCDAAEGEAHAETCALYVAPAPTCTCEAAEGEAHAETCALYVAPAPTCSCDAAEGEAHAETCALYVAPAPTCTCEAAEGEAHAETCALYVAPADPDAEGKGDGEQEKKCECTPAEDGTHAAECPLYVETPGVGEFTHIEGCSDECTTEDCACKCHPIVDDIFNVEEAYEYVMRLETNEEKVAYLETLSQEELEALEAYAFEMDPPEIPVTNVFTNAGPFMPAVSVASARARMSFFSPRAADDSSNVSDNGLSMSKTATDNRNGTYTLRLESYVTGKTVTSTVTKTVPVDIVLVLDQSGSMENDFDGNSTRQNAMKQAVNNFIDSVGDKYDDDTADHRIAIVTFDSDAHTIQGWTYVNADGVTELKNDISELPDSPSGSTNVAAGMTQAETLMSSDYDYTGTNTDRQKVVIVFTDGVPTTRGSDFNTEVATSAISTAKTMKDDGVTVYSVGIFNGADRDELYGEKWAYAVLGSIECTGEVGSYWGGSWFSDWVGRNDFSAIDIAAGNRFLNYLSSNFKDANEIGLDRGNFDPGETIIGIGTGTGYKITANYTRSSSSYYLTASDAASLNSIFQSISSNIQTGSASMELGSETVIKDVISDYFTLPNGASNISVYTADYTANETWKEAVKDIEGKYTVNVDYKNVTVTGFDYSANYVDGSDGRLEGDASQDGDFYGRKLILEIVVKPEDNLLGGNLIPTNGAASGIYSGDELVGAFDVPTIDFPVAAITPSVQDQNIYLTNSADLTALLNGTDSRIAGSNNDYVDVWYQIYDDNTLIGTYAIYHDDSTRWTTEDGKSLTPALVDDKTYTVKCTVSPVKAGASVSVTSVGVDAKVNVYKPTVTFRDSSINAGATPDYANDNLANVEWTHLTSKTLPTGDAPVLTYTYDPAQHAMSTETTVKVTGVMANNTASIDLSNVKFMRNTCEANNGCEFKGGEVDMNDENHVNFIVHINTFDLTIAKTGVDTVKDPKAPFVFNVMNNTDVNINVVIYGNDSVTIEGLPVGTYTVSETNGYWRYECQTAAQTVTADDIVNGAASVSFENNRAKDKWLDDFASATNIFG